MFSTILRTEIANLATSNVSSATAFNLDKDEILSIGKVLNKWLDMKQVYVTLRHNYVNLINHFFLDIPIYKGIFVCRKNSFPVYNFLACLMYIFCC